jgi:hypothetical protein
MLAEHDAFVLVRIGRKSLLQPVDGLLPVFGRN